MRAVREDGEFVELAEDGTWKFLSTASDKGDEGFRGVRWGTPPEVAKEREGAAPSEEIGNVLYWADSRLGALSSDIAYIYANNILVRAKYLVSERWVNENRYIMEFNSLKKMLTKKYGNPDKDDEFWNNLLWKDDYDDWGKAVQEGHLSMYSTWISGGTRVILSLDGENYSSSLGIEYTSLKLESIEDNLKENEFLELL